MSQIKKKGTGAVKHQSSHSQSRPCNW